jgi:hypothetical protein
MFNCDVKLGWYTRDAKKSLTVAEAFHRNNWIREINLDVN